MNIVFSNYGKYKDYIDEQVEKYNRDHSDYYGNYKDLTYDDFGFFLIDEDDCIFGGVVGRIMLNWAQVDIIWVDEKMRNQGNASLLLSRAENYAKEKNCTGMKVETFDLTAKEFYEYMGFKVAGSIDDLPPGHKLYILAKYLKDE